MSAFVASMRSRPSREAYYLAIARAAAERSNCSRRQVGAVLVKDDHVISTGYNGTPKGAVNCDQGGCPRCASDTPSGVGLSRCLCVHAEANAIALSARYGVSTDGALLYTTVQPCIDCTKLIIQAGVSRIYYAEAYAELTQDLFRSEELQRSWSSMLNDAGLEIVQLLVTGEQL